MKKHLVLIGSLLSACTGADEKVGTDPSPDLSAYDLARGGRLFDKFYGDYSFTGTFDPDTDTLGSVPNDGHDYRLKNFFGWDLQGAAGIYGPDYAAKSYVLPIDLLDRTASVADLAEWFTNGGEGLPPYGDVLAPDQIDDMAAFVVAMRTNQLPRASDIWALSETAPSNYTLLSGADPEAGHEAYASSCAACHGLNGTLVPIEDEFTLGTFARQKAYEGWYKVLVGHPGSTMGAQVPADLSAADQAAWILDVFAALCDREAYPATGASGEDVQDGDPRCGEYLR